VGTQGQQGALIVIKEYFTEQEILRHSREHMEIVKVLHHYLRVLMTSRGRSETVESIQEQEKVLSTSNQKAALRTSRG
jgi:hypothetical protein